MDIGITVVATNKYRTTFLERCVESLLKHFLVEHDLSVYMFVDEEPNFSENIAKLTTESRKTFTMLVSDEGWPGMTYARFRFINSLPKKDAHYYIDVDSCLIDDIGEEVFSDRVALMHSFHPLLNDPTAPREKNPLSVACIPDDVDFQYYWTTFFGGFKIQDDCAVLNEMVLTDTQRGINPIFHDEMMWNRFLIDNPPTRMLPAYYAFVENEQPRLRHSRIMCISKVASEFRGSSV